MRIRPPRILWLSLSLLPLLGCTDPPDTTEPAGKLSAALGFSVPRHDVTAVRFDVVAAGGSCDDAPVASTTVLVEKELLPHPPAGAGAGGHWFSDGLFVLPPGLYVLCATPLAEASPSSECERAQGSATVVANQTVEAMLVSQCPGKPNGGLDVVVAFNDPPRIHGLTILPSKFINECETAKLAVSATDPNADALSFAWSVVSGPGGRSLHASGDGATFSGPAGDYLLTVSALDVWGAVAAFTFPIHVSPTGCAVPLEVQAIFAERCVSCHGVANPGGLTLLNAATAYANLVGVRAAGSGCMDRVRVTPGNAATSYLIAKLRNISPICGLPMPRNRPPLPEAEIAAIEAWINGLPVPTP
jgi:hypothetical protein